MIKHSQRTVKCRRCGRREFYWFHDPDRSGFRTCSEQSCPKHGEPVSWVLADAYGEVHRCGPNHTEHADSDHVDSDDSDRDDYAESPQPAPATNKSDADLLGTLRDLLGSSVNADQLRAEVDKAITARQGELVSQLSDTVSEAIAKLEANREPLRVEVRDLNGDVRELEGAVHMSFPRVLRWCQRRKNVFLVGPAGTGKTHLAAQVAEALGVPFGSLPLSITTPVTEIVGYRDANGTYQDTAFRRVYEHGGVFLFDEADNGNANTLVKVNEALSNGHMQFPDRRVPKHADCYILAAGNTYGTGADIKYQGRTQLDAAFIDRFTFLWIPIDEALERVQVMAEGLDAAGTDELLRKVRKYRAAADSLPGLKVVISPRSAINAAAGLADGDTWDQVERECIRKGISDADWAKVTAS